jgi:hypothetical protein
MIETLAMLGVGILILAVCLVLILGAALSDATIAYFYLGVISLMFVVLMIL